MPHVQSKTVTSSAVTSLGATFNNNVVSGNRILVGVTTAGSNPSVTGVTDSAGNTYHRDEGVADIANNVDTEIWSAPITAGGGTKPTVTATLTNSDFGVDLFILEYSGMSTASGATAVDTTAGQNVASGTSVSSGNTGATSNASEQVVALYGDAGSSDTITAGSGFTIRQKVDGTAATMAAIEDGTTGAPGTTTAGTFTISASTGCTVICVVYKLAASGWINPLIGRQAVMRAAHW